MSSLRIGFLPASLSGASHTALRIALLYASVGSAWIVVSDAALWQAGAAAPGTALQTIKGLAYVAATGLALFWLVRHGCLGEERRTERLFLGNPSPMWIIDLDDLRFLAVNEAACRVYGYAEAEFLTMTLTDLRAATDRTELRALLAPLRTGGSHVGTWQHLARDGRLVATRVSGHRIDHDGHCAALVLAQDISAEVAARTAVERSEARFHQLLDSLDEVLWLADLEGRSLYRSRAHAEVYGRPLAEFESDALHWLRCVHTDDRERALQAADRLRRDGQCESEYRIVRPDGSVRWLRDRKRLIYEDGKPVMQGGIAYDVTQRKAASEALKRLNETLEARVRERTAELEAVNDDLEAFSYSAAHDLKTPLAAIRGVGQLLALKHGGALGDTGRELLGYIEKGAVEMEALIDALLALAKVSRRELRCCANDASALARAVLGELSTRYPGTALHCEVEDGLVIHADPDLLRSLLSNLLGNAVKYSSRVAQPRVSFGRQPDSADSYFVRDNGAGFEVQDPEKLFRPFQRFHSEREFAGSGVGLATCRRIVLRHGGDIWLTSTPGEGTTVHFRLPGCAAAAEPAEATRGPWSEGRQ